MAKVSDIPSIGDGYSWIGSSVSDSGGGLFLFVETAAEEQVHERHERPSGSFPKTKMAEHQTFHLVHLQEGSKRVFELHGIDVTFPLFDLFPDGQILVAGGRSGWRSERDFDRNGLVIDPRRGTTNRILLGDGIQDLFIDQAGRIWVSYFDEGVFGNFGWGGPGPNPIGAAGLNCFDQSGKVIWRYPLDDEHGGIADCYALNVTGTDAYVYYYTEFPLCRISEGFQRQCWKTPLAGCHQFAVGEGRVLFSGQYDDPQSTVYFATLDRQQMGEPTKLELTLPHGAAISSGRLLGRGKSMHFFGEAGWFRVDIGEIEL